MPVYPPNQVQEWQGKAPYLGPPNKVTSEHVGIQGGRKGNTKNRDQGIMI